MVNTNWLKQGSEKPLFPDLLWSRPENKSQKGKLLIVGGSSHGFRAPAAAFSAAVSAGIGTTRVILPDSTRKILGKTFAEAEFVSSTPSGSFARAALAETLEASERSDGVLLAGDFGRNSETAIFLDSLAQKYQGRLVVAQDGLDYFMNASSALLRRKETLLLIDTGRLQKLAKHNRPGTPVLHLMSLHDLVMIMIDWTSGSPASFITQHSEHLIVAVGGKVSTTAYQNKADWEIEVAAYASVWWLQQPTRPFEALATALHEYLQD